MSGEHETPIEARLRPALSEGAVARVWSGIREGRGARRRARSRRIAAAGGLALAAAILLGIFVARPAAPPGALRAASGRDAIAVGEPLHGGGAPVALDDGSRVTLDRSAELEVLANDGERFVTLLRRGRGRFAVQPGGPRRWVIETDLATVEVVGTELVVERGESGLVVTVDHGVVLVRGERVPGRVRRLRAGERLEVPAPEAEPRTALAPVPEPVPAPEPDAPALDPIVETAAPAPARPRPDLDARIADADAARAGGRPEEAARILERAVREGGDDPRASLAAFSLGRLQLEVLARPEAAAESFARVVERGSPRALVEDAQARRVEALVRAGRDDEARRQARTYEARWPAGRRLAEVRALIGE